VRRTAARASETVMPITLRADTSVPILGLNLPRACNDAFSKSKNVKSSATYDIPTHCFRRRNSDVIREHRLACVVDVDHLAATVRKVLGAGLACRLRKPPKQNR
jgi:hypothetical protein